MEMAVQSMEMALGAIFYPLNFVFDSGGAAELFVDVCRLI
jgi:hypothetical protein